MYINDYSESEIINIVKSFKNYIKIVIKHAAIDYSRKAKRIKNVEISLNELSKIERSLSVSDDDLFSIYANSVSNKIEDKFSEDSYIKAISVLNNTEIMIFKLSFQGYSLKDISIKLNTTTNCIKATKSRAKKKVINKMEELKNGRK